MQGTTKGNAQGWVYFVLGVMIITVGLVLAAFWVGVVGRAMWIVAQAGWGVWGP